MSGIAFRGNEHRLLLSSFHKPHEFVVSQDVQEEALRILREKFPRLRRDADEAMSLIRTNVVPREVYESMLDQVPVLRDPKDAHVLAAAIASDCDILVTGDKDILVLPQVGKLRILKPAAALRLLASNAGL